MKSRALTLAISALLIGSLAQGAAARGQAEHIILLIGDGMNIEHEIATSRYLYGLDLGLLFHDFAYQGNVATWDVNTYEYWSGNVKYDPRAVVPSYGYNAALGGSEPYPLEPELPTAEDYLKAAATDSASAATAWATGYKTDSGNIAWLPGDPDDGALETIAETLRDQLGYAIGVVSTVPFTHATPAAHVSHNKSRGNTFAIGTEILTVVKPEVVIGGGHPGDTCQNDNRDEPGYDGYIACDDYNAFAAGSYGGEYVFAERAAGVDGGLSLLNAAQQAADEGKKLFGLYGLETAGNFESLEPHDLPATPDVKQATNENPTLAESTLAALKVLSQDEDGFFVMIEQGDIDWANHANDFQRMVGTTKDLEDAVKAAMDFVDQPGDGIDWNNTLLIVTSDHSNSYMRNVDYLGAGNLPTQEGTCSYGGPACTYPDEDVTYGSTGHTNELVRLYALGAGVKHFHRYENRWYPGTSILDNTHLYHVMRDAAGIPVHPWLELAKPRGRGKR
jgi:alkaline phosphatase